MLLRVAASIDQFPAHAAPLLTSTVVQCAKAKLWRSAHHHAVTLMRPELRAQLAPEHRKKVENLVRKKDDTYVCWLWIALCVVLLHRGLDMSLTTRHCPGV